MVTCTLSKVSQWNIVQYIDLVLQVISMTEKQLEMCSVLLRSVLHSEKDGLPFHLIASEQLFRS